MPWGPNHWGGLPEDVGGQRETQEGQRPRKGLRGEQLWANNFHSGNNRDVVTTHESLQTAT
eukprot:9480152-Pyramimonas_sp.AAC.1